ncbi:MAG TPA: DUF4142 domain-containing protein [Chthoniobacterales bacterium]|jgi:putative membrane protein
MKNQLKLITNMAIVTVAAWGLSLTTFAATSSSAAQKKEASLSAKDKSFMKEAAKGGQMEVDMGHMAQQEGKSSDVKKIGTRMVTDHSKANAELMAIAKTKGVDLSKEKPQLEKLDKANFDKEYITLMVKDHEKDLSEFQAEAKNGSDPEVKAFASKTSGVIAKHLAMVKEAQAKMK